MEQYFKFLLVVHLLKIFSLWIFQHCKYWLEETNQMPDSVLLDFFQDFQIPNSSLGNFISPFSFV